MTDPTDPTVPASGVAVPADLSSLKLAQLQELATALGVSGVSKLRKGELVEAIGSTRTSATDAPTSDSAPRRRGSRRVSSDTVTATPTSSDETTAETVATTTSGASAASAKAPSRSKDAAEPVTDATAPPSDATASDESNPSSADQNDGDAAGSGRNRNRNRNRRGGDRAENGEGRSGQQQNARGGDNARGDNARNDSSRGDASTRESNRGPQNDRADQDADGRNRNRGRGRDRKRGPGGDDSELEISDDDVLIPVAGILDVLDNYAFVRTTGYLPGPSDVYVSLGQVKKHQLRKGDAVVGAIRQPREGENQGRQKYNALVRVDSINGQTMEEAAARVEFNALTPLYPHERLRLETDATTVSTRLIDLVAPVGKGQRGLIVSPPKAGKTVVLQAIANGIAANNPEVHLMVVLVDERPEEVTELQRTVKGEVIASTFDRPAEDHTTVAELAIERAKRLVELGHDVVVLLDSITRLGRAYAATTPAGGRAASNGVDAAALAAPKRFFAAARNIEDGGSLTILATALVETGSQMDEAIFEEFDGTSNMELRLSRQLADQRIFPAIEVSASGTRREELLLGADEVTITWRLRRALADLDTRAALDMVLGTLNETSTNVEFLVAMNRSLPQTGAAGAAHLNN